ncbi:MAG: methyltransferase [Bryobacterales bacterium]|nr:isoprenylcysteine carboxylmethyltransferase family protein [Bryobacteraceae bacterium]MDW8129124.1 methyltransferase [Bryobacterales bacterium]
MSGSSWFPKPYADRVARLRVPATLLTAVASLWLAEPSWRSLAAGLPWMVAGLALRAWAAGHLAKNERLATGGPYAWVRNPLYLGSALLAAGAAVACRRAVVALLLAALFLLVYLPVIELEEQHLRKLFPEYEGYARRTPRLLPRPGRVGGGERFSWKLFWLNREHRALLGWLAAMVLLAWKAGG